MAASALTVQNVSLSGLAESLAAANVDGNWIPANTGNVVLEVVNGGGSSINVTAHAQANCNRGFEHDAVVAVGAGASKIIGPFPVAFFNDANGYVQITYSAVDTVTVRAIKVA